MSITNYINPAELVLAATQEGLSSPDWSINMQIVDMCNATPAIAYPVMEALKKRLQSKKPSVGLLAVALLEALVKNCVCIHPFVGNREFMELFVKTLPKKVREPGKGKSFFRRDSITNVVEVERIDRTLLLIQSWSAAFGRMTEYPIFVEIHRELQRAGVHFPEAQKDEGAPVFTPPVNYESPQKKNTIKASQAAASGSLDSKQSFRDRECQVAAEGANLLNEALTASEEGSNLAADDLIQALLVNVRASAGSIFQRIQSGTSSELELEELLRVNDICNNSIAYYQGLIRGTMTRAAFKKQQADAAKQKSGDKKKHKKKKKKEESSSEEESEEESDDEEEQKQPQVPNVAGGFVLDAFGNKVATTTPAAAAPWLAEKAKKKGTDYVPTAKSGSKKKKKKDKNVPKLAPPPAAAGKSKASHLTPDAQAPLGATSPPTKTATAAPAAAASTPAVDPLDLLFGNISTPSQPVQPVQQTIQPQFQQQQQQHQPSYTTPFHSSPQALNPFTQPNPYVQQQQQQQQPPLQHQASNPFFQSQPMIQQPVSYFPGQQQQASMNFFQQQPHPYAAQQTIQQQQSHYGQAPFAAQQHLQAQAAANPFGGPTDPFGSFNAPAKPTPAASKPDDFGSQTAFGAFGFVPLPNRTAPIASQPTQQQVPVDDDPWAALATRDSKPAPKPQAAAPVDDLDDFAKLAMR